MAYTRTTNSEKIGLTYWMECVLDEHSKVEGELTSEPVHDLRVSLRRCILIADLMRDLDPGSDWKAMRKTGRRVFHRLGALRDTQMLAEWIEKLTLPDPASRDLLLESLKVNHEKDNAQAQKAIKEFDRKQWRVWMRELSGHYRHVASDRPACESLLLEIWEKGLDLHRRARKSGSRAAYHRLRVGMKKFRYAAENFLPSMYAGWASELKFIQDLLGEIHDLSVLEQTIVRDRRFPTGETRLHWLKRLEAERLNRLEQYRAKMTGKTSLFWAWREGLPSEKEERPTGLARLAETAYFLTPDFSRVRRASKLSLQLYDGFASCGLISRGAPVEERFILQAAALLQEVGHFKKARAHHKQSYRMIRKMAPPAGWSKRDLELAALIARFHRRALPRPDHKILRSYEFPARQSIILLAAILRFANAFHAKPFRTIRRLNVENYSGAIVVRAEGFPDRDPLGRKLADARRLLEFVLQRPLHVLSPGSRLMVPQIVRPATHSDAA